MPQNLVFAFLTSAFSSLFLVPAYTQTLNKVILIEAGTGKPVPYATVEIIGKGIGTVSEENGTFELDLTSNNARDTLSIRNLGYYSKSVPVSEWLISDTIFLRPQTYQLKEVDIVWQGSNAPVRLGVTAEGPNTSTYGMVQWTQIAVHMAPAENTNGTIANVQFYVPKSAKSDAPFRVRVYACNPDGSPGDDLLHSSVVVHSKRGDEWVTADLKSQNIEVPEQGCFVAMEWINSGKQYRYNDNINGQKLSFYGQKLGSVIGQEKPLTWIRQVGTDWRPDNKTIAGKYRNAMIRSEVSTR